VRWAPERLTTRIGDLVCRTGPDDRLYLGCGNELLAQSLTQLYLWNVRTVGGRYLHLSRDGALWFVTDREVVTIARPGGV
jgi:hypothetical protein